MADVDLAGEAVGSGVGFGALSYHYVWTSKQVIPAGRLQGLLVLHGGFLYYIGGQSTTTDSTATATVYKYDPTLNTWTTATAMSAARTKVVGGVVGDVVYLYGGPSNGTVGRTYNLATGISGVVPIAPFNMSLNSVDPSCVVGTAIYTLVGGVMRRFETTTNTWTTLATDPSANGQNSAMIEGPDGKIHVFGGSGSTTTHRVYDIEDDSWSAGTAVPSATQSSPGIAVKAGLIVLAGGANGSGTALAAVRTFDTLTNTWSTRPDLPAARTQVGRGMVADANGLWLAGGASGSTGQTTLYNLRMPEVELSATPAVGEGFASDFAELEGAAVGEGVTEVPDLEVRWSGKRVYAGPLAISGQRVIDYWTERSPIR